MNTTQLLNTAIQAAIDAGKAILQIYNDPAADFNIQRKADNSPLTIADQASHNIIKATLEKTNFPILSEEGKDIPYESRKDWKTFWLVDPLDGTKEFIKRNDEFTVNIAVVKNGVPVLGVIYVPVSGKLYVGEVDFGAWRLENVKEAVTSTTVEMEGVQLPVAKNHTEYRVVGSRSHLNDDTKNYVEGLKDIHPEVEMVSKGSSLKICMVAEGAADEYPRFGPTMEWDTAAGHALANAAGKHLWLTDFSRELQYNKENLLNPYFIAR